MSSSTNISSSTNSAEKNSLVNNDGNKNGECIMTPKMEVMMKREAKKIAEASQLTFKPKLIESNLSKRWSLDNSPQGMVSNRFDRLYSDAQKRKEEEKQKNDRITAVADKDLTFQPKISPRAASRERSASNSSTPSSIKKDHIERMYNSTGAGRSPTPNGQVEKLSFSPQITKRASSIDRSYMRESGERLYSLSLVEREKHEKAKLEADQIELASCTFSPNLSSRPGSRSSSAQKGRSPSNVADRMQMYEEKRRLHIEEAVKMKREREAADSTFKPNLSTPTFKKKDELPSNVFERLAMSVENTEKKVLLEAEMHSEETFKPTTNNTRPMTPTNLKRLNDYDNVHDRLYKESEERRALFSVERQLSIQELEKDNTFKPKIIYPPSREDSDVASNYTGDSVFDRLSTSRQYMQNMLAQMKSDMEMYECTFQPQTSASETLSNSSAIHRFNEPVHERLNKEAEVIKQIIIKNEEKNIEKEMIEATFAPKIPKKSEILANKKHYLENKKSNGSIKTPSPEKNEIHVRLNAEAATIRSEIIKREELKVKEELKEATFAPHIPVSSEKIVQKRSTIAIPYPKKDKNRDRSKSPINERLYDEAKQIKALKVKNEEDKEKKMRETATFKPHIPESSEKIVAHKRETIVAAQVVSNDNKIEARIESLRQKLAGHNVPNSSKQVPGIDNKNSSPLTYQENPVRSLSPRHSSNNSINSISNVLSNNPNIDDDLVRTKNSTDLSIECKKSNSLIQTSNSIKSTTSSLTLSPREPRLSTSSIENNIAANTSSR